jgi:hypothetical protein
MRFWADYVAALLHYWWTLVVVGVGALFTFVWPFLPGSVHQLPAISGWVLAYGGILVAQALAARRVALSASTLNPTSATTSPALEATMVVVVDTPGMAPMTVTSVLRAGPSNQNTITVSPTTPDAGITGLDEPVDPDS